MVTHDLGIARQMDRAIILRDGKIIADGASGPTVDQFVALFKTVRVGGVFDSSQ